MKNCLVIGGPTASGKTTLGVALAVKYNGEVVSCDSRQVYRGMDIGTGKDLAEYHTRAGAVPCHLIDIVDPGEIYTVYRYQRDFYSVFQEIVSRHRLPVIIGGTGLYLEAVLRNYRISAVPENQQLRSELMARERESLERDLERLDPQRFAATDCSSKKRIVRSIEVAMAAAASSGEHWEPAPEYLAIDPLVLVVRWERGALRERIRLRLERRLELGMVDEVKRLLESGIPRERFDMFGLEYRYIARYIKGEAGFEEMKQELYTAICRFAKRQETWFRGMERRGVALQWVDQGDFEEAVKAVERYDFTGQNSPAQSNSRKRL